MQDDWASYLCRLDDEPASIFLNLALRGSAPIEPFDELVCLRITMNEPRYDGLSSREEFDRLCTIEDAVTEAINAPAPHTIQVGSITSIGYRDFIFYTADVDAAKHSIIQAMKGFADYGYEITHMADAEWSGYLNTLYPDRRSYELIRNARILSVLENHGDDPSIERQVDHWLFFPSREARDRFKQRAGSHGYNVIDQHEEGPPPNRHTVQIGRTHDVHPGTIDNVVLELYDWADEFGGEYDGWETSVECGSDK